MFCVLLALTSSAVADCNCVATLLGCGTAFYDAYKTKNWSEILKCTTMECACSCGEKLPNPVGHWVESVCALTENQILRGLHETNSLVDVTKHGSAKVRVRDSCGCLLGCGGICIDGHCEGACI